MVRAIRAGCWQDSCIWVQNLWMWASRLREPSACSEGRRDYGKSHILHIIPVTTWISAIAWTQQHPCCFLIPTCMLSILTTFESKEDVWYVLQPSMVSKRTRFPGVTCPHSTFLFFPMIRFGDPIIPMQGVHGLGILAEGRRALACSTLKSSMISIILCSSSQSEERAAVYMHLKDETWIIRNIWDSYRCMISGPGSHARIHGCGAQVALRRLTSSLAWMVAWGCAMGFTIPVNLSNLEALSSAIIICSSQDACANLWAPVLN